MDRRTFLAVAGAGAVSGCVGRVGLGSVPHEIYALDATTEKVYPSHQYHFSISYTGPDGHDKELVDYFDLDPEIQDGLERIFEDSTRSKGINDPPSALLETVDDHLLRCRWLCHDAAGKYAEIEYAETDPDAPPLADLTTEVTDGGSGIRLTLANRGESPMTVGSAAGPPFGPLKAVGVDGTDHHFDLWCDYFREAGQIWVEGKRVQYPDVMVHFEVPGGTTVTRTYELSTRVAEEFVAGRYVLSPSINAVQYVSGRRTDIPLAVRYSTPARPTREVVDFSVEFSLTGQ